MKHNNVRLLGIRDCLVVAISVQSDREQGAEMSNVETEDEI